MSLVTTIRAAIQAHAVSAADLGVGVFDLPYAADLNLASGTGANQADQIFADQRILTTGSADSLDLAGVLTDPFGNVLTFIKIKALYIKSAAANTTTLTVGNGTNPALLGFGAAAHTWIIPAGGALLVTAPAAAGWPVTASTADILKITNAAGASATYDIAIVGTSA